MEYKVEVLKNNTMKIVVENKYLDVEAVYKSGQCFNCLKENNKFTFISKDKLCLVLKEKDISYIYCLNSDLDYWKSYFNFDIPFYEYLEFMKEYDNEFIKKCANYSSGLILLKQDLWEIILSFIISQRKSIPSIITSINRLKTNFGKEKEIYFDEIGIIKYQTIPSTEEFIWSDNIEECIKFLNIDSFDKAKKLKECGLGYRDSYILYAANWFNSLTEKELKILYSGSYEEHFDELLKIKGVGKKVANCICLFAFNDFDSFPIDVWIQRILDKGLLPEDLSDFDGFKGFLQQIIFYYTVNNKKEI